MAATSAWRTPYRFLRRFLKICKAAWLDVRSDLREAGWWRCFAWLGFSAFFTGFPVLLVLLINLNSNVPITPGTACMPDGSFKFNYDDPNGLGGSDDIRYNFWKPSDFFQITLGFGALSFTVAKIIDVSWDIVSAAGFPFLRSLCRPLDCGSRWTGAYCVLRVASLRAICDNLHGSIARYV